MIRVAGYCRVSTDKADQANSFAAQRRYFREYISARDGWDLWEIYADEGITGTSTKKRAEFNRMIHDAKQGKFQIILTKEVSRFSRNILDTICYTRELKAYGVSVRFLLDGIDTMSPDAELYLAIMASMAQEESRKTSERVIWGQTRQMEKGCVFGHSLLGYTVKNGVLTIEPNSAETIHLIFRKYALEQVGTTELAKYLNREGYRTGSGSCDWRPSTIIKLLKNEKYVGDLVQKKTFTSSYLTHEKRNNHGEVSLISLHNHHEPIISRELWELTQMRLRQNNKHSGTATAHSNRYCFSGKIRCGTCGKILVSKVRTGKNEESVRRWSCRSGCGIGRTIRDDTALDVVKTAIRYLQLDQDAMVDAVINRKNSNPNSRVTVQQEIKQLQCKKERMLDGYCSGILTEKEMLALKQRYEQRLNVLQEKCSVTSNTEPRKELMDLLNGNKENEVLFKNLLQSITIYGDNHLEVRFHGLPQVFHFSE